MPPPFLPEVVAVFSRMLCWGIAALLLTLADWSRCQAYDLELWMDIDRTAYLRNTTAAPLSFDGYQIATESKGLDPAGWKSISDYVAAGEVSMIIGQLGAGALAFGEANPNPGNLSELNLAGAATLAGGASFALGKPFGRGGYWAGFWFKSPTGPNPVEGQVFFVPEIPEPSSLVLSLLAAAGSLLLMARRR